MDERIRKVILNLQQNNMAGYFVENKEELLQLIDTLMRSGEKVKPRCSYVIRAEASNRCSRYQ